MVHQHQHQRQIKLKLAVHRQVSGSHDSWTFNHGRRKLSMRWRASLCVSLAPSAENSRSTSSTELRSLSKRSWSRRFQQSRQACTQPMARTGARRRSVDTDAGAAVYCAAAPGCMHVTPGSRGATRPHACNRSLFLLFYSARVIQSENRKMRELMTLFAGQRQPHRLRLLGAPLRRAPHRFRFSKAA